ncbi:unnamed protein product [Sphagnum jensenii]
MFEPIKSPFPYFGGKSRVAGIVWERFGDVPNYVEPFAGSLAVLLGRPHEPKTETVNDLDCMIANFWRALQADPDGVAEAADRPVNEADQHAIHLWLVTREEFRERMKTDIDYYDSLIAGRWVYGACVWIGSGWCSVQLPHLGDAGRGVNRQLPHLGDAGRGVNRQLPHLGDAGTGVHRKLPHLGESSGGQGIHSERGADIHGYMRELAERLRKVRVCCGDWERVLGPSVTFKHGITGVFLDPPYDTDERQEKLYASDSSGIARKVREWAIANGDNPKLRIALCDYGEAASEFPATWERINWKARGGYGSQGEGRGRENSERETIWFSPHCLGISQKFIPF